MEDREVFKQIIEHALAGGYQMQLLEAVDGGVDGLVDLFLSGQFRDYASLWMVIFDTDFARAVWGDTEPTQRGILSKRRDVKVALVGWQYHLQQIVIAEDRVDYLRGWLHGQEAQKQEVRKG